MSNQTFKWCWYHSRRARSGFRLYNWIQFFPPSPPPSTSSSPFSESQEEGFSVAAGCSGRGACLRFWLDHKVFPLVGHHGDPFKKMCVYACFCGVGVRVCVCVHFCVCFSVLVPQPALVLCCAVTCSQISQRIYRPVNCLWVVDKMAPIHSHMKTLRG